MAGASTDAAKARKDWRTLERVCFATQPARVVADPGATSA